jgi:hypothetical protein
VSLEGKATVTTETVNSESGGDRGAQRLAPPAPRQAGVDRFDEAIVVTRTRAWIGLAACLALVAGVVVWATTTTVDRTVEGRGVALVNGTLTRIFSPATGTITSLTVAIGDDLEPGQMIGKVLGTNNETVPLVAPIGGRVFHLPEGVGSTLLSGELVASLSATSGPLVVTMFVPPEDAQQVDVGTRAQMSFPRGGTVDGEVSYVGRVPLTENQAANAIGSAPLATILAGDGAIEIDVDVTLSPDDDRVAFDIADIAEVTLIVGSQHPIEYVV